jgi:hypothetical protein
MNLLERHDQLQERVNALRKENTKHLTAQAKAEDEYHCAYMLYSMRMNGFRADAADWDRRWRDVVAECEALTREIFVAVAGRGET